MAFASGGWRRSEVAGLRVEDLMEEEPVHANPADEHSPLLPCLTIHLGRTKTTTSDDEHVVLIGRPVTALKHWLTEAKIEAGPVFRRIDQWGNLDRRAMTPQSVNLILKTRIRQAGLDPAQFSAHGLRLATSPKRRTAAFPCLKPCSSPCTSRSRRHRDITIIPNAKWAGRPDSQSNASSQSLPLAILTAVGRSNFPL